MKNLNNTEAELKESVACKKTRVFDAIGVFKFIAKLRGKYLCWSFFASNIAGWRPATLFKKRM